MLLVCLSHIKQHFVESSPALYWLLMTVTRVATPTFLLLSGFVIGYLLRRASSGRVSLSLLDRGLFLVLVTHALMGLSKIAHFADATTWLFARVEVTDVIGVGLIVGVLLRSLRPRLLLMIGTALCLLSWPCAMLIKTQSATMTTILGPLFHLRGVTSASIEAPLVAYVGVFLIGMGLSGRLHGALLAGSGADLARPLFRIGAISVAIVLLGILAWHAGKDWVPGAVSWPPAAEFLRSTLDPRWKLPPSPAYLLFYGGIALLLTSWLLKGRPAWLTEPITRVASVFGRASLMCFVVQDLIFFGLPEALGIESITSRFFWFAYLALSVLLLYGLSRKWDEVSGNRFLTVGLRSIASLRRRAESG